MTNNEELINKKKRKSNLIVPAFIGMGIGAFFGLVAYVNNWFLIF